MATPNTYQNLTEQELVAAVKQGDCAAFKVLYELYRDRVFNLICYSLNDSMLAEDVLQNVFIKIYRALPGLRFESSLGTWIYRITHNECQYQLKRRDQRY